MTKNETLHIDYSSYLKKIFFASFIYGFIAWVKNSVDLDQLVSKEGIHFKNKHFLF